MVRVHYEHGEQQTDSGASQYHQTGFRVTSTATRWSIACKVGLITGSIDT